MSWMDRVLEDQLAAAAEKGELIAEPLKGKPIPGIDEHRPDGWWANSLIRRERSAGRREDAVEAVKAARVGFWRATELAELRALVDEANRAIETVNINLIEADQLEPFDVADVEARWQRLQR